MNYEDPDRIGSSDIISREVERELVTRAQNGDNEARRELGEAHYGFVVTVAQRYAGYNITIGELIQAGYIGLMDTIDRFDHDRGTRLLTIAFWGIRRHMFELLKNNSNHTEGHNNTNKTSRISLDSARQQKPISKLFEGEDGGQTFGSNIVDLNAPDPVEEAVKSEAVGRAQSEILKMKPRTQNIISMRLGSGKNERYGGQTFVEIGKFYGISAERVRRIYDSAIEKLRDQD
tara:strand:- start:38 stop:733 length:696 start_codon:yes stop_codon:yes gene_type:complete